MTEISSLPVNQKDPQLEEILDSLWNEGQMSDDKYQSTLDGLFINHSSELLLDSLLAPSVHSPHDSGPVPADCGGTQPGGDLGLVGDYLGVSPSHSDGYMTGQPSPFSESSLSEGTVSTVGYSPSNLLSDENLQTMLDQSATANHSGNFPMSGTTATRGETTSSPTLAELGSFEEYNFITTQSHELDLDLLEMGSSPKSTHPPSELKSYPAERKASSLKITAEERALLEAEGTYLPVDMPLTKAEEKQLRKVRRKLKNRQSAHESRQRKKEYVDGLEERVEKCTLNNRMLQKKVTNLEEQNRSLLSQLRRLQKMVKTYNPSLLQAGCVMVMVLSFSLFFIPKFLPSGMRTGLGDTALATGAIAVGVRSRALLETPVDDAEISQNELLKDSMDTPPDTPPLHLHHAFQRQEVPESSAHDKEVESIPDSVEEVESIPDGVEEWKGHNLEDL
jgi:hypothetical protein